jgi:hypothetical protein
MITQRFNMLFGTGRVSSVGWIRRDQLFSAAFGGLVDVALVS